MFCIRRSRENIFLMVKYGHHEQEHLTNRGHPKCRGGMQKKSNRSKIHTTNRMLSRVQLIKEIQSTRMKDNYRDDETIIKRLTRQRKREHRELSYEPLLSYIHVHPYCIKLSIHFKDIYMNSRAE